MSGVFVCVRVSRGNIANELEIRDIVFNRTHHTTGEISGGRTIAGSVIVFVDSLDGRAFFSCFPFNFYFEVFF